MWELVEGTWAWAVLRLASVSDSPTCCRYRMEAAAVDEDCEVTRSRAEKSMEWRTADGGQQMLNQNQHQWQRRRRRRRRRRGEALLAVAAASEGRRRSEKVHCNTVLWKSL